MFTLSHFMRLMENFPRRLFNRAVKQHGGDRYAKTLTCKSMLAILLYGQIAGAGSMREMLGAVGLRAKHLYHLGAQPAALSTFSEALAKRPSEPFRIAAEQLLARAPRKMRKQTGEALLALDATTIALESQCRWAKEHRSQRASGLKVHVAMDALAGVPVFARVTLSSVGDIRGVRGHLKLRAGGVYVMDRAYTDYNWWRQIMAAGGVFVVPQKRNASLRVLKKLRAKGEGVVRDEVVALTNRQPRGGKHNALHGARLRRVVVRCDDGKLLALLSNDLTSAALRVALWYRARWQVEVMFRWLKQQLRVKRAWGLSENAVRIQIYCALIAMLLLFMLKESRGDGRSMTLVLREVRALLFVREEPPPSAKRKRRNSRHIPPNQHALPVNF